MVLEEHPKQIPHLPLMPIRPMEHRHGAGHSVGLVRIRLHPDPPRMLHTQQMIHDLKPFLALRVVRTADVHESLELALRVVAQKGEGGDDAAGSDVQREFVLEDGELLDEFGETLGEVGTVVVQFLGRLSVLCKRGVRRRRFGEWGGGRCKQCGR